MNEEHNSNTGTRIVSFAEAQAIKARPVDIAQHIKKLLSIKSVWEEIEPFLTGEPDITENRQYDQALMIKCILDADRKFNDGQLSRMKLSYRKLYQRIHRQLANVYELKRGRVVGLLLEDKSQAS